MLFDLLAVYPSESLRLQSKGAKKLAQCLLQSRGITRKSWVKAELKVDYLSRNEKAEKDSYHDQSSAHYDDELGSDLDPLRLVLEEPEQTSAGCRHWRLVLVFLRTQRN